jgi:nitroreductase
MVCKRGALRPAPDGSGRPEVYSGEGAECFSCGHCVCVCPAGAITAGGTDTLGFAASRASIAEYDEYIGFIRSRRSARNYKKAPVPGELAARVADAARYSPTAKNAQGVCVTVVSGGAVKKLAGLTFDFYKKLMDTVASPLKKYPFMLLAGLSTVRTIERNAPAFEYGYKMWLEGVDLLFYDAPALVIVHADKTLAMPKDDCGYALYSMALAAETLGLATCINGFFLRAAERSAGIRSFIKLPAGHEVYGAMTMGYPALKFNKVPARRPVNVTYINSEL